MASMEVDVGQWVAEFRDKGPHLDFRVWPDVGNKDDVEYVVAARPPKGVLAQFPNLKCVLSMWAGVEDLLKDPAIGDIPIVRMIDPGLTNGIVTYVVHHVIGFHIHTDYYDLPEWKHPFHEEMRIAGDTRVGILGLGVLGQACADALVSLGFKVSGFSSSRKNISNIESYAGKSEFPEFLSQTDILVSILPRTANTDNMLNHETLAMLPRGSYLINCGRGEVIDDDALLEVVRSGQIAAAVLDVFRIEPLPQDHPFWTEPNITVTPHCASKPDPRTSIESVLANIERMERGIELPLEQVARRGRGY